MPMSETAQSLSLERKIKMHEARESIIERLALDLPTTINLDRFLGVIVSELGRMMSVDRCDVIQLTAESELRISHEWRADEDIPSSLGTAIPLDLKQLADLVDTRNQSVTVAREAVGYSSVNNRITMEIFLLRDRAEIEPLLAQRAANSERISLLLQDLRSFLRWIARNPVTEKPPTPFLSKGVA